MNKTYQESFGGSYALHDKHQIEELLKTQKSPLTLWSTLALMRCVVVEDLVCYMYFLNKQVNGFLFKAEFLNSFICSYHDNT